jgi:hypothetical protein
MAYGTEPQNSQNLWSGLGGSVGYKKVFKNRLLLELGFSADLNLAAWFSTKAKRTYDFGGTIQAKVGYRIANPKREGRLKE